MNVRKLGVLMVMWLSIFSATDAFSQSVTLSVQPRSGRREIAVGEEFYLRVTVKDIDANPEQPSNVPGAKVLYFAHSGQSSSFTSVNGKNSYSVSNIWTLTLRATQEGKYSFGPITVGGVKSNVVNYAVGAPMPEQSSQPAAPSPNSPNRNTDSEKPEFIGRGDGNLFMRAEVSQSSAYVNQAIIYTVKLYSTYDAIKFIGATASPKFDGFVVEESKDISTSLKYEEYNGKTYATAIIARYIIFPQHAGTLTVKGNTYTVSVDQREYYRDPFSYYGSLSVSRPKQLNVTPNDLTVSVKELPQPVPVDFSGGVGNFSISSSLPAQTFVTNQVASIVYTIEGSGNIKYVTLPDLNKIYPPELEVYTPTSDMKVNVGSTNVSGSIKYDYSFMPLEWGNYKIPNVKLVYFDPSTQQYRTAVANGYDIVVEKGTGSEKSQTNNSLVFNPNLMPVTNNLKFVHKPYVKGFLYWLFYIIPIGGIIIAYSVYKSYLSANSDLIAVRSRKANRMARRRLKKALGYMKAGNRNDFYDEILISIWGYLSDKLNIPTSELSRDNISGKLAMRDISDEDIRQLISLIDDVEFEKYAPAASAAEMNEVYDNTIAMMNKLEEAFK